MGGRSKGWREQGRKEWKEEKGIPRLSMETTPTTNKTQAISASHSPTSSCMCTSTSNSTLLSEHFSDFVSNDEHSYSK